MELQQRVSTKRKNKKISRVLKIDINKSDRAKKRFVGMGGIYHYME